MQKWIRFCLWVCIVTLGTMCDLYPINAQSVEPNGAISALRIGADQLLVGQGSTLIQGQIIKDSVVFTRSIDLKRHTIRGITTVGQTTVVLSEDGVTTIKSDGTNQDFLQGGGQNLIAVGNTLYIAALNAGVRILKVDTDGKLQLVSSIVTDGAAYDIAPESGGLLWVAEADQGIHLYDARDLQNVKPVTWIRDLIPAHVLRLSGTKLFVGHGSILTVLETLNPTKPRLISLLNIKDQVAQSGEISDIAIVGTRAYVGLTGSTGPDVLTIDLSNLSAMGVVAQIGSSGAGDRIAIRGSDMLVGSTRKGLQYLKIQNDTVTISKVWNVDVPLAPCDDFAPVLLQPSNGAELTGDTVTLSWSSNCAPQRYEVRINDKVESTEKSEYTFNPSKGRITWQITSIDPNGQRSSGQVWAFDREEDGWITLAPRVDNVRLLYSAPPPSINLNDPKLATPLLCGSLLGGLFAIVIIAWWLGRRADMQRSRYL